MANAEWVCRRCFSLLVSGFLATAIGGHASQALADCATSITGQQGGCSNTGSMSGISLTGATIAGSIVDLGTIAPNGISVDSASSINATNATAILVNGPYFSGGINNAGTISASNVGIAIHPSSDDASPIFSGNINNSGTITAQTGILIGNNVNFAPGASITNSGTISGSVAAIDVSNAASPVTINQLGGLIAGDIRLSSSADQLNISGGAIAGNIVGQGASNTINFNLGANTFTYASAYAFSGINQVNVTSGLIILDGANSATNVTVSGGTLEVGDDANTGARLTAANGVNVLGTGTLAGHGTIFGNVAIANGGTLSPGGSIGTLTINGNLNLASGSSYTIQVLSAQGSNPAQASMTIVSGGASLGGAGVTAYVAEATFGRYNGTGSTPVKIFTGTGLGGNNQFSPTVKIASLNATASEQLYVPPGSAASLSYDSSNVYLSIPAYAVLLQMPTDAPANAQNIAAGINNSIASGTAVPAGIQNLAGLSGDALNNAVTQLGGQAGGAFVTDGMAMGSTFVNTSLDMNNNGRDSDPSSSTTPCNTASADTGASGTALAYNETDSVTARANAAFQALWPSPKPLPLFQPRLTLWGASYGGVGSIAGNSATGAASTQSQTYGIVTGLDDHIAPATMIGFALGGGATRWQLSQGLGAGHAGIAQASAYGMQHFGPLYVAGALAYSWEGVSSSRVVTLAGSDTLNGNFGANVVSSRLEVGLHLPSDLIIASHLPPNSAITPYGAVQPQVMFVPAYGEYAAAGSNQFALSYAAQTNSSVRTELGTWFNTDLGFATLSFARPGALKAYGRVAWAHDFNNEGKTTAVFQQLPGSSFVINAAKPARNAALITGGLEYQLAGGWSVLAKFDGEYSTTTSVYAGTGAIQKVW